MRATTIPASVNTASTMRSNQTRSLQQHSNTDRLAHVVVPAHASRGSEIYSQVITPSIAARLRTQASLFQKVEYAKLRFEIQTQAPTTVSGGYVVAFLHDPEMDVGTGEPALRSLTAVQNTTTSKFWQSSVFNLQTTKQQYYTLSGSDIRLFSPGRLVVMVDGEPNSEVSITILMHWTVKFSRPALQRLVASLPQVVVTASILYASDTAVHYANWSGGTTFSPPLSGAVGEAAYLEKALSGVPPASAMGNNKYYVRIPNPVSINVQKDHGGGVQIANFIALSWKDGHLHGDWCELPDDSYVIFPTLGRFEIVQGTRLTPVLPDEFFGSTGGPFLVTASASVSVNRREMISKTYSVLPTEESSKQVPAMESLQEKLSKLALH